MNPVNLLDTSIFVALVNVRPDWVWGGIPASDNWSHPDNRNVNASDPNTNQRKVKRNKVYTFHYGSRALVVLTNHSVTALAIRCLTKGKMNASHTKSNSECRKHRRHGRIEVYRSGSLATDVRGNVRKGWTQCTWTRATETTNP